MIYKFENQRHESEDKMMFKMKKHVLPLLVILAMAVSTAIPTFAFTSTSTPAGGSGILSDPYYYYSYYGDAQTTWKAVVDLRYPFISGNQFGTARGDGLVKRSDVYEGAGGTGNLLYSWLFDGTAIPSNWTRQSGSNTFPDIYNIRHPFDVGIDFVEDTAYSANLPSGLDPNDVLFLKLVNNYDFCAKCVSLTLHLDKVASGKFSDGTILSIYQYSAQSAANHGNGTITYYTPGEITRVTVTNNTVTFPLSHGGSFVLIPQ